MPKSRLDNARPSARGRQPRRRPAPASRALTQDEPHDVLHTGAERRAARSRGDGRQRTPPSGRRRRSAASRIAAGREASDQRCPQARVGRRARHALSSDTTSTGSSRSRPRRAMRMAARVGREAVAAHHEIDARVRQLGHRHVHGRVGLDAGEYWRTPATTPTISASRVRPKSMSRRRPTALPAGEGPCERLVHDDHEGRARRVARWRCRGREGRGCPWSGSSRGRPRVCRRSASPAPAPARRRP